MNQAGRGTQLEVARIQSEINRLFEMLMRLRGGELNTSQGPHWSPAVDVAETDEDLIVELELPGVDPRSLEVVAESGQLQIAGVRPHSSGSLEEGVEMRLEERAFGPFHLSVALGAPVNTHKAVATLRRGVFQIVLPKVPNRRGAPVSIAVTHG